MSGYGRQVLTATANHPIRVSFDGSPDWIPGGLTLDWSLFAAAGSDITYPNGDVLKTGQKGARYGQIVCKVTNAEIQTIDLSGDDDPTGGTWSMTIEGQSLTGLAYNITAADLQTAIRGLNFPNANLVTVSKALFVYTVTFPAGTGNATAITTNNGAGFTGGGGDTFAITVTTTNAGSAAGGSWGPYDPAASDGRQTLLPGNCAILDMTVFENGSIPGVTKPSSDYPSAFVGGPVWWDRIIQSGAATHTLALGPTKAEVLAAFPKLQPVYQA